MRHALLLFAVLSVVPPACADQAPFGPLKGQIREIVIERVVEADTVPLHVALDTSVDGATLRTLCDNSASPVCLGLFAARSLPAACDFPNIPTITQDAIASILGDCELSCWIQTGNPDDFAFFREIWSCADEKALPCVQVSGTMLGTSWLDGLLPLTEGQEKNRADVVGPCTNAISKPHR